MMDVGSPLAPEPSPLARLKSRAMKEVLARAVPRSLLVTRGPGRGKRIALTFDDGPDEMTPRYLDVCDALGLRATFFLIGENVAKHPGAVAEYVRRGHEVAGHGYTHTPFPALAPAVLVDELSHTQDLLPPSTLRRPIVRPPQGRVTPATIMRLAASGYTTVLWSLDSDDCRTRDPRVVASRLAPARVRAGEIVLLHELQQWTLDALPDVVGSLRGAGYTLCTVGELLE
jgi:peptidoglycan/xylan/chitin deacetylase (PgdA/CDA1 family)